MNPIQVGGHAVPVAGKSPRRQEEEAGFPRRRADVDLSVRAARDQDAGDALWRGGGVAQDEEVLEAATRRAQALRYDRRAEEGVRGEESE